MHGLDARRPRTAAHSERGDACRVSWQLLPDDVQACVLREATAALKRAVCDTDESHALQLAAKACTDCYRAWRSVAWSWRRALFDNGVVQMLQFFVHHTPVRVDALLGHWRCEGFDRYAPYCQSGQHTFGNKLVNMLCIDRRSGAVDRHARERLLTWESSAPNCWAVTDVNYNTRDVVSRHWVGEGGRAGEELEYDWRLHRSSRHPIRITYKHPNKKAGQTVHIDPSSGAPVRIEYVVPNARAGQTRHYDTVTGGSSPCTPWPVRIEYVVPHARAGQTRHYDPVTGHVVRVEWAAPHKEAGRTQHHDAATGHVVRAAFAAPHKNAGLTLSSKCTAAATALRAATQ